EQRGAQADRHTRHGENGADQRRGGVLLGDEIHHDHHNQRMRDAMSQDRDGRDDARQRQPERRAATSGRRCQLSAQVADEGDRCHRLAVLSEPCTVATAEAPMRNDSSGSSTLMRTGKRAASRIQSSERSTDRKSTRLNSSHVENSYAVFWLKKKKASICTQSAR